LHDRKNFDIVPFSVALGALGSLCLLSILTIHSVYNSFCALVHCNGMTERSASAGKNDSAASPSPFRTADQTRIGIFWGYDGGFRIGVPPRLYNSIADDVLIDYLVKGDPNIATGFQLVKLYAMVNVVLGDAGVSVRSPPVSTCCSLAYQAICLRTRFQPE
jgi:hypothetical protein